jgi:7-carboxy-7-deazaguanine synthase
MKDVDYLLISDDGPGFHTVEGEGRLIGAPSIFLRLFGCNLTCKGWASPDSPWGCDSFVSWSKKNKWSFDKIFEFYETAGFIDKLRRGDVWKITGGEPSLRQKPLLSFIDSFIKKYNFLPRIDFESNATLMFNEDWVNKYNSTFTVSPKMSSNGDPVERTYVPDVLNWHIQQNSCFKFVITGEQDIDELYSKYIDSPIVKIPKHLIWLMVCAGSRDEHIKNATYVAELCKTHGFNFSPRLQLIIWDKALRV